MGVRNQAAPPEIDSLIQGWRASPGSVESVIATLPERPAKERFACSKALRVMSEQTPTVLYPYFDGFVALMRCQNSILRWDATRVLAGLATVDRYRKIEPVIDQYLEPIRGPQMIGAATVIASAARIAKVKPHLANHMSHAILRVERASYQTEECRNIAIGHAIDALDTFFDLIGDRESVIAFVRRQEHNQRQATRKKADRFLQRHGLKALGVGSGR